MVPTSGKVDGMPQERGEAGLLNDEVARGRSSLNERAKPVSCDMPQVCADVMGGVYGGWDAKARKKDSQLVVVHCTATSQLEGGQKACAAVIRRVAHGASASALHWRQCRCIWIRADAQTGVCATWLWVFR